MAHIPLGLPGAAASPLLGAPLAPELPLAMDPLPLPTPLLPPAPLLLAPLLLAPLLALLPLPPVDEPALPGVEPVLDIGEPVPVPEGARPSLVPVDEPAAAPLAPEAARIEPVAAEPPPAGWPPHAETTTAVSVTTDQTGARCGIGLSLPRQP